MTRTRMTVELILASYRNATALDLSLAALAVQNARDFNICVAEDGEDAATVDVMAAYGEKLRMRHVRHADDGFRKNKILNDAIRSSDADYLIFLDGDCLAHPGFVARHIACARKDRYLSGGVVRLSQVATDAVTLADVTSGAVFGRAWLARHGVWGRLGKRIKLLPWGQGVGGALDRVSLARKRWLGGNASTFRDNLLAVNGFDESLGYGAEDKEIGVRLQNAGIRPWSIRYTAPMLHLEHGRDYVERRRNDANHALLKARRENEVFWTDAGLVKPGPSV